QLAFVLLALLIFFSLHGLVTFFVSFASALVFRKLLAYSYPSVPYLNLVTYRTSTVAHLLSQLKRDGLQAHLKLAFSLFVFFSIELLVQHFPVQIALLYFLGSQTTFQMDYLLVLLF